MGELISNQIRVTPLVRIAAAGGDVMHAMKESDPGYRGFGEAYFSWVNGGAVKAWKLHQRMTLNLIVPVGEVHFVFFTACPAPVFRHEVIGESHYARITVPPGVWFGFQGLAMPKSLILNLADILHDPAECLHKDIDDIPFNWQGEVS